MQPQTVTSRHLRGATELILLVPIKPGFVPVSEAFSYADRLHTLLETLFLLRSKAIECDGRLLKGPVEQLQTIFRVQWTVLPREEKLLVTAHFDRSFEDYFKLLVDIDGTLLDLIFSHCEGYTGFSCADGYDRFAEFIRRHQQPCDFLFASNPELTLDDVRFLNQLAQQPPPEAPTAASTKPGTAASAPAPVARSPLVTLSIPSARAEADAVEGKLSPTELIALQRGLRQVVIALHDLRARFFSEHAELGHIRPEVPIRTGFNLFDNAVGALIECEFPTVDADGKPLAWKSRVSAVLPPELRVPADALEWLQGLNPQPPFATTFNSIEISEKDQAEIQGNILEGYSNMLHGCVVFVRCVDRPAIASLLRDLSEAVTSAAETSPSGATNAAITWAGLGRLGLSADVLGLFPKEFQEGMDARAGLIGDLGEAHPSHWNLPEADGETVQLSTIDVVVILQSQKSAPDTWQKGEMPERADLLKSVAELSGKLTLHDEKAGRRIAYVQPLQRHPETLKGQTILREHFGFREDDKVSSQPVPNVVLAGKELAKKAAQRDKVAAGELLLGYANERGKIAACADPVLNPHYAELFRDGSFLVMRKLEQDIGELDAYVEKNLKGQAEAIKEAIVERFVGRDRDQGRPLLKDPTVLSRDRPNDFSFKGDGGEGCPLHAHIRLANPRTDPDPRRPPIPRIMRRGFSYGPKNDPHAAKYAANAIAKGQASRPRPERGLLFMAYNASIAQQYEVVQRWLNGGNSTGLLSAHNDFLASTLPAADVPRYVTVGGKDYLLPARTKPFVSLQWGMYLFVPSRHALGWLADRAEECPSRAQDLAAVRRGRLKIRQLDALAAHDVPAARREWKKTLEELNNFEQATDVWKAIYADGGLKFTPYGVLVASADGAQEVLGDRGQHFSVREYWRRIRTTTGEHYLAFDPEPVRIAESRDPGFDRAYEARMRELGYPYAALSRGPNRGLGEIGLPPDAVTGSVPASEIAKRSLEGAFAEASKLAKAFLDAPGVFELGDPPDPTQAGVAPQATQAPVRHEIRVRDLATVVVAKLAHEWLGLPAGDGSDLELAKQIQRYVLTSRYAFQPQPEPWLESEVRDLGDAEKLRKGYPIDGELGRKLKKDQESDASIKDASIKDAEIGAVVGFAAPAIGCIASVVDLWTERGTLPDMVLLARRKDPEGRTAFRDALIEALVARPVPSTLYRTATDSARIAGIPIPAGTRVIVALSAAVQDTAIRNPLDPEPWRWLFGGAHGTDPSDHLPPHGCPARHPALGVLLGVVTELLVRHNLARARRGVLAYDA